MVKGWSEVWNGGRVGVVMGEVVEGWKGGRGVVFTCPDVLMQISPGNFSFTRTHRFP